MTLYRTGPKSKTLHLVDGDRTICGRMGRIPVEVDAGARTDCPNCARVLEWRAARPAPGVVAASPVVAAPVVVDGDAALRAEVEALRGQYRSAMALVERMERDADRAMGQANAALRRRNADLAGQLREVEKVGGAKGVVEALAAAQDKIRRLEARVKALGGAA